MRRSAMHESHLRLTHPRLDFWVAVDVRCYGDEKWVAVADFAGEPEVGTGSNQRDAVHASLRPLGEPFATEMADSSESD